MIKVRKIQNSVCEHNGIKYDVFLNGGTSSVEFHNAGFGTFVIVDVRRIDVKWNKLYIF